MKWLLEYRVRRWVLVVACCLATGTGMVFAREVLFVYWWWLWIVTLPVVLGLRRHGIAALIFLCVLFFGIGWWRGSVYMQRLAVNESLHMHKVVLVGAAVDDAVYGQRSQLEFSLSDARVVWPRQASLVGSLTIRGFGEPAVNRGDVVQVEGTLYPTRGNNLASISFAKLKVLRRDTSWINDLRRRFAAGMQSALPEPAASFGLGLLIGQRSTLPQDTSDQLRRAGLTHIIAVSGYNLTIIVMACRRLLGKRSRFQTAVGCIALIGLFLLVTGSSPSIVRAGVISAIGLGAWYYGYRIRPSVLLLVAAAVTALANPLYVWGNVSWYLSFLAFFGVLVVAPLVTKRLFGSKEPHALVAILIESVCASLVVAPYILFIFGQTSLVGLPANLLVIPLIPLAMLLSLAAGLGGMLIPAFSGWLALPASLPLTYMLDVTTLLSRVPHAFVENVAFGAAAMIASYGMIGLVCTALWDKVRKSAIITEKIAVRSEGV